MGLIGAGGPIQPPGVIVDSVLAGAGLTASGGVLAVGAGAGVTVNADNVAVDQTYGFNWTGAHTWTQALSAAADVDTTHVFGRAAIHSATTDTAMFSHYDVRADANAFALRQSAAGGTILNAKTGQSLYLTLNAAGGLELAATKFAPNGATNTIDLGQSANKFKDGYFGTTVYCATLDAGGSTVNGATWAGANITMNASGATYSLVLQTNGVARWEIGNGADAGHLLASAANQDIGKSSGSKPRALYLTGLANIGGDLDHDGTNVGFYGTAPAARQTVTGSRGGNAALASLLTALATNGLITDSSTA